MSRLGKKPVPLPAGCQAELSESSVIVKGKLGTQVLPLITGVSVVKEDSGALLVRVAANLPKAPAFLGLFRALLNNAVLGVSAGFEKNLEIVGVGYKAAVEGRVLVMNMGYSHPVHLSIPDGITVEVTKNTAVKIFGVDKAGVGGFASIVKGVRPVEPYKGKGIREAGQRVTLKEGKKK